MTEFWNKIGVTWDEVHTSDHADIWSTTKDYDPDEWKLFQQWLDHVYSDFVGKVAEGRNIRKEKVLEVAEGRVWTGEDAKNLGLVDELGGFPEALRLARQAAGIPEGAAIQLKLFPREETLIEMLSEMLFGRDDEQNRNGAIARVVQRVRPLVRLAGELGLFSDPGVLTMPHVDRIK
jgi:protease-4